MLLHIPHDTMDKFIKIIQDKSENIHCYILNPNIDDLIDANIFKLQHGNETLLFHYGIDNWNMILILEMFLYFVNQPYLIKYLLMTVKISVSKVKII